MDKISYNFRNVFKVAKLDIAAWFPGHMNKGLLQMQQKLRSIDCIIEIHDARIPFSGRNPTFSSDMMVVKPHILLLNKMDLAVTTNMKAVKERLRREGLNHVFYVNCKEKKNKGLLKVVPAVVDLMKNAERFNRNQEDEFRLLVIGIPNVGKSTLINVLRNMHLGRGNATPTGRSPGITRTMQEKIKISETPRIFVLDTPGVLSPTIRKTESALKLALCETVKDSIIEIDVVADYCLFFLNKHRQFQYVDELKLKEPTDHLHLILIHIANSHGKFRLRKLTSGPLEQQPDIHFAAQYFLRCFRDGKFGKVCLDVDILESNDDGEKFGLRTSV